MVRNLSSRSCPEIRIQNKTSNIKIDIMSFEKLVQFKYVGRTVLNLISIHEEIRSRLKTGNVCCYSVQKLLSSSSLSKDI